MAKITVKDLSDSMELDRKAMLSISGGARTRGRQTPIGPTLVQPSRLVNYPAGFGRIQAPARKK